MAAHRRRAARRRRHRLLFNEDFLRISGLVYTVAALVAGGDAATAVFTRFLPASRAARARLEPERRAFAARSWGLPAFLFFLAGAVFYLAAPTVLAEPLTALSGGRQGFADAFHLWGAINAVNALLVVIGSPLSRG